jgi:uncharacterized protein
MHALPLHLDPGADVRQTIAALARQRGCEGFVLGVVGNLSQAAFQCPGQAGPTLLQGELEIITLQGTFSPQGVHLHLSLADGDCQVWGGHLEPGSLVLKGADLLLGLLDSAPAAAPASTSVAAGVRQPRVVLAVLPGCPYSNRALRLLRTLGIPFTLVEPREGAGVPQVSIDGVWIGGYSELAELHGRGELEGLRQA